MKRTIAILSISAVAALSLSGCVFVRPGATVTETREIEDVESLALETSGDVTVMLGSTPSLTITAGENTLDRLTSEVVDGVLVLGTKPGPGINFGDVHYELTVTRLQAIALDGSGDIEANFAGADDITINISGSGDVDGTNVDAKTVVASIDGSGDIELAGVTGDQTISIAGSGGYDGSDLTSTSASVDISGSGGVEVMVTGTLAVDISGSGDVTHSGGATITQQISGSGSVRAD